jgi:predicted HNH restriction endonuclease
MKLELADGRTLNNPDRKTVENALASLDRNNNDHAILDAGSFIQTATTSEGYLLEYRDNSGYFRSEKEDLSLDIVKKAFISFLVGDNSWKESTAWVAAEDGQGAVAGDSSVSANSSQKSGEGDFAGDIVSNIKKSVKRNISRKIGRFFKF